MKKFLAIAVIAASLVACNNSGEKKAEGTDTTTPAVVDTTAPVVADTTAPVVADTTAPVVADTTKK